MYDKSIEGRCQMERLFLLGEIRELIARYNGSGWRSIGVKRMRGGQFHSLYPDDRPSALISWLSALHDARRRTQAVLTGINPWDAVVRLLREKHHLLISESRAEHI